VAKAEAIDQLPKEREGVAKALNSELKALISKAVKDGSYKVPSGSSAENTGLHIALSIEHALHVKHRGNPAPSGNPYLEQFRSLRFNLKKNETLLHRLLSNSLSAETLVEMSTDELASEELQKERAAIKEVVEKQAILTHEVGPRYRKTHKGEEIIGEDHSQKPAEEYIAAPVRRPTIEHQDIGPIDTGSPPPGVDLPEIYDHPMADAPQSASAGSHGGPSGSGASRVGSGAADIVMGDAADDPELDRLLNDDAPPRPTSTSSTKAQAVWRGRLSMNSVGSMNGSARIVAGEDIAGKVSFLDLLGPSVEVDGRIAIDRADTYVSEMRNHASTTSVWVLQIQPNATVLDQEGFHSLWKYFMDRSRWGVISQRHHETVRDVYVVPIDNATPTLPRFLNTLGQNSISTPVQGRLLLLAVVVRKGQSTGPPPPSALSTPAISTPVNQMSQHFSPITTGLPVGMAPPHANPFLPPGPAKPADNLVNQILGPLKDAPVVSQILSSVGAMSEIQLQNLRDILEREPGTRDDIQQLSDHLQRRQREISGT
jgi:hypothetical protein